MKKVRKWAAALAALPDSPERIAAAYAWGVHLGFSPWFGLHTVIGLLTAETFRFNRVAVLLGVWTNLPWLNVPYYAFATWVGIRLLRFEHGLVPPVVGFFDLFSWDLQHWLISQWRLLIPAAVGSMLLSVILAVPAYGVALLVIRAYRRTYGREGTTTAVTNPPNRTSS